MPKQSIKVFCKYEADDSIAPLKHMESGPGFEQEGRKNYLVSKQL
jgi:hypothetical protein